MAADSPLLETLFPPGIVAAELRSSSDPCLLLPEEAEDVPRAGPKRLGEFTAGRLCARHALARLGLSPSPLRVNEDRTPRWPEGIAGSITHTNGFYGAVVGRSGLFRAIGVDAEVVGRVTPEIRPRILTDEESEALSAMDETVQVRMAALAFAAKEAFYKCQFPLTGEWLDFRDVALDFGAIRQGGDGFTILPQRPIQLNAMSVTKLAGRFRFADGFVFAGIALVTHPSGDHGRD